MTFPAGFKDGREASEPASDSGTPDLSDELASAYHAKDLETFTELLSGSPPDVDPNHWYPDLSPPSTLLELASRERGRGPYVRALLSAGADPNRLNPLQRHAALHLAAEAGNAASLEELLRAEAVDVNKEDMWGCTPLHLAASRTRLRAVGTGLSLEGGWIQPSAVTLSKEEQDELEHGYRRCVQLLLRHPRIDVNKAQRAGLTAVHVAARGDAAMVRVLLTEGGSRLNVDAGRDAEGRTARAAIRGNHPQLARLLPPPHAPAELTPDRLFFFLYSRESKQFLAALQQKPLQEANASLLEADDGSHTLLQLACQEGLCDVVKALLKGGADPNRTAAGGEHKERSPLVLACFHGHFRVVRALVTDPRTDLRGRGLSEKPLHAAVQGAGKVFEEGGRESSNHRRCVEILLARGVNVNALNQKKPALYHAARHGLSELVEILLKAGANVSCGDLAITDLPPRVLRAHFDERISTNGLSPVARDYEIVFDYTNLTDPYKTRKASSKAEHRRSQARTEPPAALGGGQRTTYGWRDTGNNSTGKTLQVESRGDQIVVSVEKTSGPVEDQNKPDYLYSEAELLLNLAEDPCKRELLQHPLIASFLHLKWRRHLAFYVCANILPHFGFCSLVTVFALAELITTGIDADPKHRWQSLWATWVSWSVVGVAIIYFILEIVFRLPQRVFLWRFSLQDLISVISIVVTAALAGWDLALADGDVEEEVHYKMRRQLAAVAVLAVWLRHILLWAPVRQQFAINSEMFKRVSWNCAKVLLMYAPLLLAFTASLYILLHNCPSDGGPCIRGADDKIFRNPLRAIFESFVMLTGELDTDNLPLESFPGTSHVLFLFFVFLVSIVLFNLLLGLAVSDTHDIRREAEMWAYVTRAEHLFFMEYAMVWHRYGGKFSLLDKLNFVNLFSRDESERRVRVFPNNGNRVQFPSEKSGRRERMCGWRPGNTMDSKIMQNVGELLQERNAKVNANVDVVRE